MANNDDRKFAIGSTGGAGKPKKDRPPLKPPASESNPDPRRRLGNVFLHGGKLKSNIAASVTDANISWSVTEISQLSLTIADPGFELFREGIFEKGVAVLYREQGLPDLEFRVAAVNLDGGPTGTGGIQIQCRSQGVQKLKKRRGAKVMKKASPSNFVEAECKAAGLKCVSQPSPKRAQVARDVAKKGNDDQGADKPSSWTTFQRLATELGYYCFEFAGTVYFGKPTWLIDRDKDPLVVALPLDGAPDVWVTRTMPTINMSEDAEVPVEISNVELEKVRFKECRPGGALRLRGLPPFNAEYLITSLGLPLMGTGTLSVSASTPKNPPKQPPPKPKPKQKKGGYDGDPKNGGGSPAPGTKAPSPPAGGKSALAFVNMAITASSARYVYGAEASVSTAKPAALDCSELVQWALGRIGVPFTDGSSAQIAATRRISVEQGLRTRGALLWMPGHIGISMGDGRSVEARNPSAGVGIFRARDISWQGAGLVPGVQYA